MRFIFSQPPLGPQWQQAMVATAFGIDRARDRAAVDSARLIRVRGQQDIRQSGRFGTRWTDGLTVEVTNSDRDITVAHDQPGAHNFEFGGVVHGKPLLWIPLSFAGIKKGQQAKNFPGGLFRVDRKSGKPLLLSRRDRKPKFVGVTSVRINQRWHLREITINTMNEDYPQLYSKYLDVS